MAAPPPNIMHNKDSEVSNSRTNQVIYLWTSWEISNNKGSQRRDNVKNVSTVLGYFLSCENFD